MNLFFLRDSLAGLDLRPTYCSQMRVGLVPCRGRVVWPLLSAVSYKKRRFMLYLFKPHRVRQPCIFPVSERTPPLRAWYDASLCAFRRNMRTLCDKTPKQSTKYPHPLKRMLHLIVSLATRTPPFPYTGSCTREGGTRCITSLLAITTGCVG